MYFLKVDMTKSILATKHYNLNPVEINVGVIEFCAANTVSETAADLL